MKKTIIKTSNKETFTWDQINTALVMKNYSPAQIIRFRQALKQVVRENLTVITDKD